MPSVFSIVARVSVISFFIRGVKEVVEIKNVASFWEGALVSLLWGAFLANASAQEFVYSGCEPSGVNAGVAGYDYSVSCISNEVIYERGVPVMVGVAGLSFVQRGFGTGGVWGWVVRDGRVELDCSPAIGSFVGIAGIGSVAPSLTTDSDVYYPNKFDNFLCSYPGIVGDGLLFDMLSVDGGLFLDRSNGLRIAYGDTAIGLSN